MSTEIEKQFLDHYEKTKTHGTAKSYRQGLSKFVEWYSKRQKKTLTARDILEQRKEDVSSSDFMRVRRFNDLVLEFGKDMQKDGYGINTARTLSIGVVQFFAFYGLPIKASFKSVITKKQHVPEISEFRRMFSVADLRGKVILSLGLDLGWRIGDFTSLKKSDIPDLNQECPIQIEKLTSKEKELSSTFISCESVSLLREFMPNLPSDNEFLFPNRNHGHLDDETINDILKDLAQKINMKIPNGKHFTFHGFRYRILSTATNLGIDTEVKSLLVGKAIDASHMTYYGDLRLKNAFVQIRTVALALTQTANEDKDKTIENLRKALEKVEDENTVLQTRIEQLKKRQDLTETTFKEFTKRLTVLEGKKETKKETFKPS